MVANELLFHIFLFPSLGFSAYIFLIAYSFVVVLKTSPVFRLPTLHCSYFSSSQIFFSPLKNSPTRLTLTQPNKNLALLCHPRKYTLLRECCAYLCSLWCYSTTHFCSDPGQSAELSIKQFILLIDISYCLLVCVISCPFPLFFIFFYSITPRFLRNHPRISRFFWKFSSRLRQATKDFS